MFEAVLHGPAGLRKPVALKVLHRGGGGMLRREARIGGLLRHRHLVDVYEVGEADGQWFAALELCAGGSLAARLPLPPRAVVEVGLQVCDALQYAHDELGLVHLDLKPANLLLDGGDVKVGDLGIARATGFDDHRDRGTPGYMAPEQAQGRPVDTRADVHALGVTLVELATGCGPAAAPTLDGFHDEDDAGRGASVPGWLAPVVERCLEADPAARFPDVAALATALRALPVVGPGLRDVLDVGDRVPPPASGDLGPEPGAFVGRDRELAVLAELLDGPGLVVLKGPPGIGKSRLALAAARRWCDAGHRPGWRCELSEVATVDGFLYALGAAMDLPLGPAGPEAAASRLADALATRGELIAILDGCDRLQAAAPILAGWRAAAPEARIVVTTRNALRVEGGESVEVGPLDREAACALVVVRARLRGVEVEGDPALPGLAAGAGGVPLALELAAGRLGVLSLAEVEARLSLSLLRGSADGRHGTLRAAIDESWEALGPTERSAMTQLSVFAGGFTMEAAEAVLDLDGASVLDVLGALADRSMVSPTDGGRLVLLGSLREYAAERLGPDPGLTVRHGRWFARSGSPEALAALTGPKASALRRELGRDLADLAVACGRAVERGDGAVAVATLQAAWAVLQTRGPIAQAASLVERVASSPSLTPAQRASAARVLGRVRTLLGRLSEASDALEEALRIHAAAGDRGSEGIVLAELARTHLAAARTDRARELFEAALERHREAKDRAAEATTLVNLGNVCGVQDRLDEAWGLYEAALRVYRGLGHRLSEGTIVGNLGNIRRTQGRLDEAEALYEAALAIHRETGHRRGEAVTLGNLGRVQSAKGRSAEAVALHEAALHLHREVGDREQEGIAHRNLAALAKDVDPAEATRHSEAALRISREFGNARAEGMALVHLADLQARAGDAGAEARFDEGERLLRAVGERRPLAIAALVRAEMRWRRGDADGARAALAGAEVLGVSEDAEARADLARIRRLLSDA